MEEKNILYDEETKICCECLDCLKQWEAEEIEETVYCPYCGSGDIRVEVDYGAN